ncbi:polysaccharide biosynthesis protein [Bdellovibrio sp. HCB288]|uniref:polysaccharide biosynthesis protein n=1 Tax=Bdellovibrio sp. HCB288 TaxID=3394355 RepID=UPI0039B3CE1A
MMYFDGKTILVTGGTGSMGKTFVRRVLSGEMGTPKKLIVLSRDEGKQHQMRVSYLHNRNHTDEVIYNNFKNILEFRIGDVRDYADVCAAVKNADIVINAAALKQVPACEYFPEQAILTNCIGAYNIVRAVREHGYKVDTVMGISTDKACKPINAMGMSKSLQERVFIAANITVPQTRFLCVRYGNVLASRGSVIPLFHEQIKAGGPITITDGRMTRFLLSLNQAVDTVFAALLNGQAGEIFVPRAPSSLMTDVAKALVGNRKIEIQVTGIRPGEKLHEIMISDEEAPYSVEKGSYYAIRSMLPELNGGKIDITKSVLKKEFSSDDALLDYEGTVNLLKKHSLMVDDNNDNLDEEMLR